MKSRHAQYRVERSAHRLPDSAPLLDPGEEQAADAMADAADRREDDEFLAPVAHFRAERCLRGRSPEEDWLAARVEADGQPEWREVFSEIDEPRY